MEHEIFTVCFMQHRALEHLIAFINYGTIFEPIYKYPPWTNVTTDQDTGPERPGN